MKTTTSTKRQDPGRSADGCEDCGIRLTAEEEAYYLYRCEDCERDHHERVIAWQHGANDRYLDHLYQNEPGAIH